MVDPAICSQGEARPIGGIPIDNRATGQIPACPVLIIRSGNAGLPVTTFSTADCYSTAKGARKRTADIGVALETVEATVGDIASSFERFRRLRSDEVDRAAGRVLPEQRTLRPLEDLDAFEIISLVEDRKSTRLNSSH